jgi:hypothetical protein
LKRLPGVLLALAALVLAARLPLCPFANFLGMPCPGCGMTRATLALLSGDVSDALAFQPLIALVLPLAALLGAGASLGYLKSGSPIPPWYASHPRFARGVEWAAGCVAVALIGVWLARFAGLFGGPVAVHALWSMTPWSISR